MNPRSRWLFPLSFALAYFAGAELGDVLSLEPGHLATLWPPSGLYLAVLLFTAPRRLYGGAEDVRVKFSAESPDSPRRSR